MHPNAQLPKYKQWPVTLDHFKALRTFVRIADEGGFAAAARALNTAPAVVTRLLAELETHLGARLIHRTTRRMALTDVGEAYLERARQIVADVDDAAALAASATRDVRGHLRVLAPPGFVVHQLARRLPEFRRAHPNVTIEMSVPGPVEAVDDTHDVSILMTPEGPRQGDIVARRLAVSEVVLCAAPAYLAGRSVPQHPSELAGHELLLPGLGSGARRLQAFTRGDEVVELAPPLRPALTTGHLDTTYAALLAGMGVAGLPSFVVGQALVAQQVVRLLPQWRLLSLQIHAAVPTRKHLPARTRAFMDFLVQAFGGADDDPWLQAAGCPTC